MKICVHVVNIDNYYPELFNLCIKTVERFCNNHNFNLNIITKRKWPKWPILTEKLQVYDYGLDYDWNLLIDADILVHPNTYNPFKYFDPREVGNKDEYKANMQLRLDKYFIRDGRNLGLSGCVLATSRLTHDLWEFPTDLSKDEIINNILQERKIVDEYVISRNLAKYSLKYRELFPVKDYDLLYHLGSYAQDENKILDLAKEWMKKNWR